MKKRSVALALSLVAVPAIALAVTPAALDLETVLPHGGGGEAERVEPPWEPALNLTHRDNSCGAHATMAVLYSTTNKARDPYAIHEAMP